MEYQSELQKGISLKKRNQKLLVKFKKEKPKDLDDRFQTAHEQAFQEIDCLKCANCCKTTSPIFLLPDIERLAKHFKINTKSFIEKYLQIDEDKDYVLQSSPCPFLLDDNYCSVYNHRPKACREYPHTNRKKMHQITALTLQNSLICPAVVRILDLLVSK